MDVHQWHCNTAMYQTDEDKKANKDVPRIHKTDIETGTLGDEQPFSRLSFVCYLRERLRECDDGETHKYFKKIGFDPTNMVIDRSVTRKNKQKN